MGIAIFLKLAQSLLGNMYHNFISPNLKKEKKNIWSLSSNLRLEIVHPISWVLDLGDN